MNYTDKGRQVYEHEKKKVQMNRTNGINGTNG